MCPGATPSARFPREGVTDGDTGSPKGFLRESGWVPPGWVPPLERLSPQTHLLRSSPQLSRPPLEGRLQSWERQRQMTGYQLPGGAERVAACRLKRGFRTGPAGRTPRGCQEGKWWFSALPRACCVAWEVPECAGPQFPPRTEQGEGFGVDSAVD